MTETSDADDSNTLALRAGAVLLQRAEDGDTATKHRRGDRRWETVGDRDDEVAGSTAKVSVAAEALAAVLEAASVGADHALAAVRLAAGRALVARAARVALRADADAVANLDVRDVLAYTDGDANDLVAHDLRVLDRAPAGAERVQVARADAAVGDRDIDVRVGERLGRVLLVGEVANGVFVLADPALEGLGNLGKVRRGHIVQYGSVKHVRCSAVVPRSSDDGSLTRMCAV